MHRAADHQAGSPIRIINSGVWFKMKFGRAFALGPALAASIGLAHPAHAGTSTAAGTANFTVLTQCSIAGSTINLGTFTATQTFQDVANAHGYFDVDDNWIEGTRGTGSLNLGSVTCDSAVPYTANIQGSGPGGAIILDIGGNKLNATVWIKTIGNQAQADAVAPNLGAYASDTTWPTPNGVGTGAPQAISGTVPLAFGFVKQSNGGTANLTDQLGTAGTFTDTLVYTLNF